MPPSTTSTASYRKGIGEVLKLVHTRLKLNARAMKLLDVALVKFNQKVMEALQRNAKKMGKIQSLRTDDILNVIQFQCPKNILKHASAEGIRALMNFQNGFLQYRPNLTKKKPVAKKLVSTLPKSIMTGVNSFIKDTPCLVSFDGVTRVAIAKIVEKFSENLIAATVGNSADNENLSPRDVTVAVENKMGPVMAEHAHAQGLTNLAMFEKGLISFRTEEERKPRTKALRVKKLKISVRKEGPKRKIRRTRKPAGKKRAAVSGRKSRPKRAKLADTAPPQVEAKETAVLTPKSKPQKRIKTKTQKAEKVVRFKKTRGPPRGISKTKPKKLATTKETPAKKIASITKKPAKKSLKAKSKSVKWTAEPRKRGASQEPPQVPKKLKLEPASEEKETKPEKPKPAKNGELIFGKPVQLLAGKQNVTIANEGATELCKILIECAEKIARRVQNGAIKEKTMSYMHVVTGLKALLPASLFQHALSEGARALTLNGYSMDGN